MNASSIKRHYSRALKAVGETCQLTRGDSAVSQVRCRISGYKPFEIAGTIMQGDQRVIALASDMRSFPVPPRKGDKVQTSDGRSLTVVFCDGNTRKFGDTIVAYEFQARGA